MSHHQGPKRNVTRLELEAISDEILTGRNPAGDDRLMRDVADGIDNGYLPCTGLDADDVPLFHIRTDDEGGER